jgi:hypothetical protein
MAKEPTQYWPAPEIEKIAGKLVPEHHKHLVDFDVTVVYLFTNKVPKVKGKEVWGQVHKITGRNAYLAKDNPDGTAFFTITVPKDVFDVLPEDKQVALVDHYLCQCWAEVKQAKAEADVSQDEVDDQIETDNPVKLSLKPYDVEEYACIVRRHGLWREDVEALVDAALKGKDDEPKAE